MKNFSIFVFINLFVIGVLYVGLAVPLVNRQVKPNGTYGYKVQKTLADEEVWYKTNEYFGKQMIFAGSTVILSSILLIYFSRKITFLWLILLTTIGPIIPLAIAILKTTLFLRKF